jgi:quercetin dioxygenase-like cupin family protein
MMDLGGDESHEVVTGSMLFIEPDTQYQFVAGENGALLLGGPCPPDPSLYLHLGD